MVIVRNLERLQVKGGEKKTFFMSRHLYLCKKEGRSGFRGVQQSQHFNYNFHSLNALWTVDT